MQKREARDEIERDKDDRDIWVFWRNKSEDMQ